MLYLRPYSRLYVRLYLRLYYAGALACRQAGVGGGGRDALHKALLRLY